MPRGFVLALAGLLIVACIAVAALRAGFHPAIAVAPTQAPAIASSNAPRLWYPVTGYPTLTLPDGRERTIRSVLNIRHQMTFGDYVWDEAGVPRGPVWVRVDLAGQLISVFRDGHEIGSAVILYGAESKPTPAGSFTVLQKAQDYHSITYDAPMPFMLRLTADGVAIHASNVRDGWATHGCIGVPMEFARRLYDLMQLGDPVVIVTPSAKPATT